MFLLLSHQLPLQAAVKLLNKQEGAGVAEVAEAEAETK
jgi:hypothetical protein